MYYPDLTLRNFGKSHISHRHLHLIKTKLMHSAHWRFFYYRPFYTANFSRMNHYCTQSTAWETPLPSFQWILYWILLLQLRLRCEIVFFLYTSSFDVLSGTWQQHGRRMGKYLWKWNQLWWISDTIKSLHLCIIHIPSPHESLDLSNINTYYAWVITVFGLRLIESDL